MNKKRLIGYLFVMVSAGCIHAQEKKVSAQEYKLGMTVPHRYGPKLYPWETGVWGQWYMERREQNKYN